LLLLFGDDVDAFVIQTGFETILAFLVGDSPVGAGLDKQLYSFDVAAFGSYMEGSTFGGDLIDPYALIFY
jgi:hypothetical protein